MNLRFVAKSLMETQWTNHLTGKPKILKMHRPHSCLLALKVHFKQILRFCLEIVLLFRSPHKLGQSFESEDPNGESQFQFSAGGREVKLGVNFEDF